MLKDFLQHAYFVEMERYGYTKLASEYPNLVEKTHRDIIQAMTIGYGVFKFNRDLELKGQLEKCFALNCVMRGPDFFDVSNAFFGLRSLLKAEGVRRGLRSSFSEKNLIKKQEEGKYFMVFNNGSRSIYHPPKGMIHSFLQFERGNKVEVTYV